MQLLRRIWNRLEPALQVTQQRAIAILENKLRNASRVLSKLLDDVAQDEMHRSSLHAILGKSSKVKRIKYALLPKNTLNDLVKDFQAWADLFDPSWYLIARLSDHDIDKDLEATKRAGSQLQVNINRPAFPLTPEKPQHPIQSLIQLRKATRDLFNSPSDGATPLPAIPISNSQPIPYSSACTARILSHDTGVYIIDRLRPHPSADKTETLLAVKRLAKALTRMDPSTFGLLRCTAVSDASKTLGEGVTELVYDVALEIPKSLASTMPQSLRGLLLSGQRMSINARLSIAKSLATSLLYLSTTGFVHKSIRSDNVLVFHSPHKDSEHELSAFLVGFEDFRLTEGTTYRTSDELLRNEIYRHPQRQGRDPERRYHLRHDVYSLGVVMLELGLWMGLVDESGDVFTKNNGNIPFGGAVLGEEVRTIRDVFKRAKKVQCSFLDFTNQQLPGYIGEKYAAVVERCLNDENWDIEGESSLEMGVQYVEDVVNPFHMITV